MLFLIAYDRKREVTETFRTFSSADREVAANARLDLELDLLRRGIDLEVVILEADDESILRTTHSRYFLDRSKIADASDSVYDPGKERQ